MNTKYFLSPGLEVVSLRNEEILLALYGNSFTIKDSTGIVSEIISSAAQGIDILSFVDQHSDRFFSDTVEVTVRSLVKDKILVDKKIINNAEATLNFLFYSGDRFGEKAVNSQPSRSIMDWKVFIIGTGSLAENLLQTIQKYGITVTQVTDLPVGVEPSSASTIVIVCSDFEDHEFFRVANTYIVNAEIPALFVSLNWQHVRCGPFVVPKANACYECYYHRLGSTRRFHAEFLARSKSENILYRAIPNNLAIQWASILASTQVLGYLTGGADDLHLSPMREVEVLGMDVQKTSVLKLPRCPVCGSGSTFKPMPAVINGMRAAAKA